MTTRSFLKVYTFRKLMRGFVQVIASKVQPESQSNLQPSSAGLALFLMEFLEDFHQALLLSRKPRFIVWFFKGI